MKLSNLVFNLDPLLPQSNLNMRAARYYGPQDIRIDEVPEPVPQPGQVKIKVRLRPPLRFEI